jgi:putative transposase
MQETLTQSEHGLSVSECAVALGISRATAYRTLRPSSEPTVRAMTATRQHPRALSPAEREALLQLLNSKRFRDQPPREVYGALLTEGHYFASVSTMYRLLREHGQSAERRDQRAPASYHAPAVHAEAPNEVWVWDITRLPGPRAGVWFYAYMILDLFSRYVVGWMVAENENAINAEQLFITTLARHQVVPATLCVHSDRGSPMTSSLLQDAFAQREIASSFSRPQVSNDNPHAEASFRTLKAQPDMPRRFNNLPEARTWIGEHVHWCNEEHHHSSLALFTPSNVFTGQVPKVLAKRQQALDSMWQQRPERFPNGPPVAPPPPTFVAIDPDGVHAHGEEWHDTSPLNPLRNLQKHHRKPRVSDQKLLVF